MTRNRISGLIAAVVFANLLTATGAWAQSASIRVTCNVDIGAGQLVILPVFLHASPEAIHTARFKVVPSCNLTILAPAGGEFDLVFSPCIATGAQMGTIICQNTGPAITGCSFDVVPATGHTRIELTDCDGYAMTGIDAFGWYEPCDGVVLGGYRPSPADGAVNVPIDTKLGWVGSGNTVWMADNPFDVRTSSAPDRIVCATQPYPYYNAPPCGYPVDPGLLLPNTTYYWQTANICWGCNHGEAAYSETYSFTTGSGPLATEHTTWGRVKSLYRE